MKRKFRRTLATVMAAALTVSLMGTADAEAAKKIKLSKKSITVTKGKSKTVTVKNVKAKKVKKLTVKSSKKKIATVKKSGKTKIKVKGKKAGSAKVTVSVTLKGKKATRLTLKVKVKNAKKKTTTTPPAAPATAAPATTAPGGPQGGGQGGQATNPPSVDATDKPGDKPTDKPGDPTKVPGTPTPNPWDGYEKPDPAANVTLKYNDQLKSEENPNGGKLEGPDKILFKDGEGYPEGGIDLMKYDRVIVKVAATAELTGDGSWYGKLGLNSSDSDYTGLSAYDDGMGAPKYMNDVPYDNGYVVTFAIPGDIDQETWSPAEISEYADAINMQLANADEYANLTVTEIAFESDKQPQESDKPGESAKPSGAPDESAKPSGTPDESAKPSGAPDESAKPSEAPDESAKPSGAPDESTKPSGAPSESAKPSDEPSPTPLAPGEKEIEGVVCKAYELEAAKDYTITTVKADGSKEITELPLTELPNLLNKITDVAGTYEKWMDTLEYTKTVNGVTFEVATADEDLSGEKQITVSGSTNARLNGEFEVSVTKNGAVYEATVTKKGSTAEPAKLTITDGSDAVVVTGKYNGTDYRMTAAKDQSGIKVYTDDTKLFARIVKTDTGYEMDVKKEEVEKRGLSVAPSTKKDPQKPTPTPVPTSMPEGKLDLSKADVCKADGDDVVAQFNGESGYLDITLPDFQAVVFKAPDNGKVYKYVKITYTGEANTVETFDENMTDGMTQNAAGKHDAAALTPGSEEKAVVYEASADHAGGCLKGIKFANVYSGKSVDLHIKSIEFSETAFPAVQIQASLALTPESVIAEGTANAAATVEITGSDAAPKITWASSNEEVAKVAVDETDAKKAVVTGVAAGTAEITVTVVVDGKTETATKSITVEEKLSVTGEGTVKCDKTPVGVGDEATLSVDGLVIKGAKTTTTTWAIDEECKELATIDAATGKITGVAAGTVKVTATVTITGALNQKEVKTVSGEVVVSAAPQPTINATVTLTKNAIVAGQTTEAAATVTVTGSEAEPVITWSSSDEEVATVEAKNDDSKQAVVTGVAAGTAEIRVTVKVGETEKTFKADIEVKVELAATGGAITVPEGPLFVGKTATLTVTGVNTNGTVSQTEWAVAEADKDDADIDASTGVITAKKAGASVAVTATVTVTGELEQTKMLVINGTVQTAPAGLLDLSEDTTYTLDGANVGTFVKDFNDETGCLDLGITKYTGILFKAPDDGKTYKYAKVTYTGDGADTVQSFDGNMTTGANGTPGSHNEESLAATSQETTVVYAVSPDHVGDCLKGVKFVNVNGSKDVLDLHIKSVEFLTELTVELDFSKVKLTTATDGAIKITEATEMFSFDNLTPALKVGDKVKVNVEGRFDTGATGFRILLGKGEYLGDGSAAEALVIPAGTENISVNEIITLKNDEGTTATHITFKGISKWDGSPNDGKMNNLTFTKITITYL